MRVRSAIDYFMNLLSNLQGPMGGETEMVRAAGGLSGKSAEIRR